MHRGYRLCGCVGCLIKEAGLPKGVELKSMEGDIRTTVRGCYGMNMINMHLPRLKTE
jgi:hypothetical protein